MKQFDCDLYMDLMPLVRDGAASAASRETLEAHLRECESCAALFQELPEISADTSVASEQSLTKIRRRMGLTTWLVLLLTATVGSFLTMTENMGYNLILFPVVGVIAYCGLGSAAFRAAAGVAAYSFLTLGARLLTVWAPASASEIFASVGFSLCYGAAFLLGVGGAWLLSRAVEKPKEDNMKNRVIKIVCGVSAVAILAGVLYLCDAFLGNPISCAAARNHSQTYLQETYPGREMSAGEPEYDWYSAGGYFVTVSEQGNPDGDFLLQYDRLGRLVDDTYDAWVGGGQNTFHRISMDCQMAVTELQSALEEATGLSVSFALASDWPSIYGDAGYPFDPADRIILAELEPGGDYDTMELLASYGTLNFWGHSADISDEALCRILTETKRVLEESGIPMRWVDVNVYNDGDQNAGVATFPVDAIGSPDFEQQVAEARQAWAEFQAAYEIYIDSLNP